MEDEAERSLLECRVCFEPYGPEGQRRPRNLPCGHVLCGGCLGALQSRRPECPFCRRPCGPADSSECRPLLQLLELLGPDGRLASGSGSSISSSRSGGSSISITDGAAPAALRLRQCLGGWGSLLNPSGVASCRATSRLAVTHDGKQRIHVYGPGGPCVQRFAERGDLKYPLDVTVTADGHVVVTDGGDRAVKAFDSQGRGVLAVREGLRLPWGVDGTAEGAVLLADAAAGALFRISADFPRGMLRECRRLRPRLASPRAVAVCRESGNVAVVEHPKGAGRSKGGSRVKVFSADMELLGQVDSFGLQLAFHAGIDATAVAFDGEGRVVVADVGRQAVISLGKPQGFPAFHPLVTHGLSYPVGLTYTEKDSLVVVDGGDHSIKIYSSS